MTELAAIETVLFLQSLDLFRFCTAEQILRLAAIARERRLEPEEPVFRTDDPASALFCVVQGRVQLTSREGDTQEVAPLGTFGFEEILCGRVRSRSAMALEDTLVLQMDAEDFFDLLSNNIEIVKALFRRFLPE